MRNRLVIGAATAAAGAMMIGAGWLASTSVAAEQLSLKICHATNDPTNPYSLLDVPYSSFDDEGDSNHSLHSSDIIPPDIWVIPAGLNWTDENRAIWENGCVVPAPTTTLDPAVTTTTTTTTEVTTTTLDAATTTTAVASDGPTSTTSRSATSVASAGPTTTALGAQGSNLPRTGASTSLLLFAGVATMSSGMLIVAFSRRPA